MGRERPEGVFVESQAVCPFTFCLLHFLGTSFKFAVLLPHSSLRPHLRHDFSAWGCIHLHDSWSIHHYINLILKLLTVGRGATLVIGGPKMERMKNTLS